jgi:hypothetical protein
MNTNANVQRSSVVLDVGLIVANTTKDVTFANGNARYSSASPSLTDRVVMNPIAANSAGVALQECFVSAASVITARFSNVTTANVSAGTAVGYNVDLVKATGAI